MRDVVSGYSGQQLSLHAVGLIVTLSGVLVVAPLSPAIIETFSITPAKAGLSVSLLWACNALLQYPGGRYADGLSSTLVLLTAQFVMILGFLTLSLATTFLVFALGLALVGAGYGMFEPAGMVLLGDLFDDQRGRAFGIRDAAVNLGSVLSAALAAVVLTVTTWRLAFLPVAILLAVVTLTLLRVDRGRHSLWRFVRPQSVTRQTRPHTAGWCTPRHHVALVVRVARDRELPADVLAGREGFHVVRRDARVRGAVHGRGGDDAARRRSR
ncbi:MFS transporter [Haloarchaeobius sp. DFWS5]|uniref:MFS transporter n=1 Tax=Haloarchaeobius sp. DFWS5 TaxID=3446114 RepID=UPI003EB74847